ncbi:MAG: sulfatase-like hydrolase/transferase [Planctomycetes bacterium]|nr:sulfatase-like hydrolase/transferase [Planctomycetota bacterium]
MGVLMLVIVGRVLAASPERPNIIFAIADDWGWPHSPMYGDPVVKTPAFDRIAKEGVLFDFAYVSAPSCTPSRGAVLTGQYHWRLEEGANLWSTLQTKFPTYPLLLEKAGYFVGHWRKAWGPGRLEPGGYTNTDPAGPNFKNFEDFITHRPKGAPFCFWLGAHDPHRPYVDGQGKKGGIDVDKIPVPGFWPNVPQVRSDIADYYFAVQRFDSDVAHVIDLVEKMGELENTIIVVTGDHGLPFPRCKSNLYDMSVHVPLAIRWGAKVPGGRRVTDFVSFVDLAPTFLDAAGVPIPDEMTGRSLLPMLESGKSGRIDPARDHAIFGKERHVPSQARPSMEGYPSRAMRTDRYVYIRNFKPGLWPDGIADATQAAMGWAFSDTDDGPTKAFIIEHRDDPQYAKYFEWNFAKRPAEELYDLSKDPDQLHNVATDPEYKEVRERLSKQLTEELRETADPRVVGGADKFDEYLYYGGPRKTKETKKHGNKEE